MHWYLRRREPARAVLVERGAAVSVCGARDGGMQLFLCAELAARPPHEGVGADAHALDMHPEAEPALARNPEAEPALDMHPEASLLQRSHRRAQSPATARIWLRACRTKNEAATAVLRAHRRCWCSVCGRTSLMNSWCIFSFPLKMTVPVGL